MSNDYFKQSIRALQLAGMSESTQEAYTRSVRQLVDFYDKTPDKIDEKELDAYSSTSRMKTNGLPPLYASPTAGSNSFSSMSLNRTGIFSAI